MDLKKILSSDWLKIVAAVLAIGMWMERSNSGNALAQSHEPRLKSLEDVKIEHTEALRAVAKSLEEVAASNKEVNRDLQLHKLMDASDTARIEQALQEINRLRSSGGTR